MDVTETFHPLAQTTRVLLFWQVNGQNCLTTFYYRWLGGITPTLSQLQALATEVWTQLRVRFSSTQNVTANIQAVETRNMDTSTGLNYTYAPAGPWPGSRNGDPLAGNSAARIFRKSAIGGRSKRGAIQVSGFAEADVSGNTLGSTLMSLLINLAIEMLVQYVGGVFIPATPSFKLANSSLIGSTGVNNPWVDSQKTRLTTHGD